MRIATEPQFTNVLSQPIGFAGNNSFISIAGERQISWVDGEVFCAQNDDRVYLGIEINEYGPKYGGAIAIKRDHWERIVTHLAAPRHDEEDW